MKEMLPDEMYGSSFAESLATITTSDIFRVENGHRLPTQTCIHTYLPASIADLNTSLAKMTA
jgi:hypothetical protein